MSMLASQSKMFEKLSLMISLISTFMAEVFVMVLMSACQRGYILVTFHPDALSIENVHTRILRMAYEKYDFTYEDLLRQ